MFGKFMRTLPDLIVGLHGVRRYLMRKPVPLTPQADDDSDERPPVVYPAALHIDFSLEETELLRRATRQLGPKITLNDLLTRDLFLTIGAWRTHENIAQDEDWLRLMIPTDLRTKAAREMPGANVVGAVFLDRRNTQLSNPRALLDGIHDELDLIKSHRLDLIFVGSVLAGRLLPGGLRRIVPRHRRLGTAIFSNIGRLYSGTPLPRPMRSASMPRRIDCMSTISTPPSSG